MKAFEDLIIFENENEVFEIIDVLECFIKANSRYEEDENITSFWQQDIAYEMRPRLRTARALLHELIKVYENM